MPRPLNQAPARKSFSNDGDKGPFVPKQAHSMTIAGPDAFKDAGRDLLITGTINSNAYAPLGVKKGDEVTVRISGEVTDYMKDKNIKSDAERTRKGLLSEDNIKDSTQEGTILYFEKGYLKRNSNQINAKFVRKFGRESKRTISRDDAMFTLTYDVNGRQGVNRLMTDTAICLNSDIPSFTPDEMKDLFAKSAEQQADETMKAFYSGLSEDIAGYDSFPAGLDQLEAQAEALRIHAVEENGTPNTQASLMLRIFEMNPQVDNDEEAQALSEMSEAQQDEWRAERTVRDARVIELRFGSVQRDGEWGQATFGEMIAREINSDIQRHLRKAKDDREYKLDESLEVSAVDVVSPDFDLEAKLAEFEGYATKVEEGEAVYYEFANTNISNIVDALAHLKEAKLSDEESLRFEIVPVIHGRIGGKSHSSHDTKKTQNLFNLEDANGRKFFNTVYTEGMTYEQRHKTDEGLTDDFHMTKAIASHSDFDTKSKKEFCWAWFTTNTVVTNVTEELGLAAAQKKLAREFSEQYNPTKFSKSNDNNNENGNENGDADPDQAPGMTPA